MSTHDLTPSSARATGQRLPEGTSFTDASVVQLISGDPGAADALVVPLHSATVVLAGDRIAAVEGEIEWSWLVEDLEAVHHAPDGLWSILVVPGVPDYGVAVSAEHVGAFRRSLDHLRSVAMVTPIEHEPLPVTPPSVLPSLPIEPIGRPDDTVVVDLDVGPFALPIEPARVPPVVARDFVVDWDAQAMPELEAEQRSGRDRSRSRPSEVRPSSDHPVPDAPSLAGLEAREISAWFGTHNVLDRVSLEMPAGQVTALIGPSGCGKSTFLRILNRMHELIPSAAMAGEVLLDGEDVYDPARKLTDARRQIGMVFQKPNPFPAMSIYDNAVASLRLTGTKASTAEKDELVETCLSKAGLWNEVRDRLRQPGGGLSGGQQQRLCIARALAIRPRVLLMDEPCSALDPTSTRRIEQTIQELASEVTIVIVTHNMQQAQRVSDRCAFFLAEQGTPGVIVEHGPTDVMFGRPQDPRTNDYVNGRFG